MRPIWEDSPNTKDRDALGVSPKKNKGRKLPGFLFSGLQGAYYTKVGQTAFNAPFNSLFIKTNFGYVTDFLQNG